MTLKELAQKAGVSVSTVSRVVNKNDTRAASEDVRTRIWQLVHDTGYIPNHTAQNLRQGVKPTAQKHSIVCVFARSKEGKTDPFFSQIFHSAEHECLKHGYDMTGVFSALEFRKKAADLSSMDGVIVLGRYSHTVLSLLKKYCRNIVYTGLNVISDPYDQVICDGYTAAKAAVRYLYSLGHRHIGYIGEKSCEARYRGYYDAMQECKLPIQQQYVVDSPQSMEGGYISGQKLLTAFLSTGECACTPPTAIFCANDITTIGVMCAIKERGMKVPGDISIIGIDNTELCQYTKPALTSIDIPKDEMGRLAVKMIIDRIEGGHHLPIKLEIPFTETIRGSCAPIQNL